jgi:glycerol kinase
MILTGRSRNGELCLHTVASWLLWKLGGQHLAESGSAARTQLLDITPREWDPWLLDLFGIPRAALPRIVSSVGRFTGSAGLDPLPPEVPSPVSLGTRTRPCSHTLDGIPAIACELDGLTYALEGNIRSSGATLAWLARLFGPSPVYAAREAAEDIEGFVLIPAFTGLGAPWWDDQAQALLTGLRERSASAHLARAGLKSIVFQIEDVVAVFEQGGPVSVILADGGPSVNQVLMQLQADTSGREVASSAVAELSAMGQRTWRAPERDSGPCPTSKTCRDYGVPMLRCPRRRSESNASHVGTLPLPRRGICRSESGGRHERAGARPPRLRSR